MLVELDAVITGVQKDALLARAEQDIPSLTHKDPLAPEDQTRRILLDNDKTLEPGRRVRVSLPIPLIINPPLLIGLLAGIYIVCFLLMIAMRRFMFPMYRGIMAPLLCGAFLDILIYQFLKMGRDRRISSGNTLLRGRITSVYPDR